MDPAAAAAAKAQAEENARKKAADAAAEAEARRKEQTARVVKPILPYSSMFIFSSTNPYVACFQKQNQTNLLDITCSLLFACIESVVSAISSSLYVTSNC